MGRRVELRGLELEHLSADPSCSTSVNGCELKNTSTQTSSSRAKRVLAYWVRKRVQFLIQSDEDYDEERRWSKDLYDLLDKLTAFNPSQRPMPEQALRHRVFQQSSF